MSERVLDIKENACLYFVDWQKPFDPVDWTKLLEMLRNIRVNRRERRLIFRQECCMSPILFNLYGEYLMKEALTEVGDFKIGGRIINKVRFADDKAIIAKTQEELQDMVNRLVNTGRKCGMEINIDKSQVMRVSRSNESLQIKVNNRELRNVLTRRREYGTYLATARRHRRRIKMQKRDE